MIQLVGVMWMMAIFFGIIGFLRGINKEIISMSGIILALFALFQFDQYIRGTLLANVPLAQVFIFQSGLFVLVTFFAYQTRALGLENKAPDGRNNLQSSILGGMLGLVNGYLIWGSIWYFMDINQYPLAPYVVAPSVGSPSADALGFLPLVILGGGVGGSGDFLAVAVIVLFLIVLIVI